MKKRTSRNFPCKSDPWPMVETWALETGFRLCREEAGKRLYRKGGGWLLMAPSFVEISRQGTELAVEAWVKADLYLILSIFGDRSPEAAIESGGLTASVPRKRARDAVNRLLGRFGQPPIA